MADSYLRQLTRSRDKGPTPETSAHGRRSYSFADIRALREFLDESGKGDRRYLPHRSADQHLQVICVANFKGGSAKTTTSAHLAQYLALRGYRVLAVDLDPQASSTALHGISPNSTSGPTKPVRRNQIRRPEAPTDSRGRQQTYFPGLDLIPGNIELMEFEHESPDRPRAEKSQKGRRCSSPACRQRPRSRSRIDYDVVIIDCPPQLGFLTLSALCAATALLVTVHPQMLDIMSMCQFLLMTSELLGVVRQGRRRHAATIGCATS